MMDMLKLQVVTGKETQFAHSLMIEGLLLSNELHIHGVKIFKIHCVSVLSKYGMINLVFFS